MTRPTVSTRSTRSTGPTGPAGRRNGWFVASQRLGPYLDPAIAVLAVVLSLVSLLGADAAAVDPRLQQPDALAVAGTVLAAGGLAWRRSRPLASYVAMWAGGLVVTLSDHYIGLLSVLILFSLFSLAAHGRRRDGLAGLAAGLATFVALALLDVPDLGTTVLLQSLALLVAAWAIGDGLRSRRHQQREQERDRVEAAVAQERLRIARELHDVVAHSMSLIAVQAGVGAHVVRSDAAAAEQSLEIIAETSRRALEQTRGMLGLLREAPGEGTRPPTQGLEDVPALVHDLAAAGLQVHLEGTDLGARPGRDRLARGVPHRAGVPDQRGQALRGGDRDGPPEHGGHRPRRRGVRPRTAPGRAGPGVRPRAARPAREGAAAGRDDRGRCPPHRLPGVRHAADGGGAVIRVVVVDDQDLVRAGFVLLLRSAADVEVVGEASNGLEAVTLCRRTAPDVVLMDVRMPHLDGLSATRTILADPVARPPGSWC